MTGLAQVVTVAVALAVCGAVANADIYYVHPDGVSGDFPTIQAAIDSGTVGTDDVIKLHSGTFTGAGNRDVSFKGKAITVESMTGNPEDCIIDCQGGGRGFQFVSDEGLSSILRGVKIINGLAGTSLGNVGGAIRCGKTDLIGGDKHGSPTIENCVITGCSSGSGGGMSLSHGSAPMIIDCVFTGNDFNFSIGGHYGGGLYCINASPTLIRCRFIDNDASVGISGTGGGMYCEASAPELYDCVFVNNRANIGGGFGAANGADPILDGCIFVRNSALAQGGATYFNGSLTDPTLTNCTFYANAVDSGFGAAVAAASFGQVPISRSILAMSTQGTAVYTQTSGGVTMTCCDVYGNEGGPGAVAGQIGSNNNFSAWPGFCDPSDPDYGFTIRDVSPCAPAQSPCGQLIGAGPVDCTGPLTYTVCPDGSEDFTTIQTCLDACLGGDTAMLCDATFTGDGNRDLDCTAKSVTVRSESGDPSACVIDCGGTLVQPHRGFTVHSGEGTDTVIRDLTIRNGFATVGGGGAIWCDNSSSPSLVNCVFEDNHSNLAGGAIACTDHSSPEIDGCVILDNDSVSHGGGLMSDSSSSPHVIGCRFEGNDALDDGGGIAAFASMVIEDTLFERNTTVAYGGGIAGVLVSGTVTNCIFKDNHAGAEEFGYGGGLAWGGGPIDQCTFIGNTAVLGGGGAFGSGVFTSCTFHANGAPAGGAIDGGGTADNTIIAFGTMGAAVNGGLIITCCDVYGNAGGPGTVGPQIGANGNIAADPEFCDAIAVELYIDRDSDCAPPNEPCGLIGAWPVDCCDEDTDGDGDVDIDDMVNVILDWGTDGSEHNGDVDGSGVVDIDDVVAVVVAWGSCNPEG
jgi:predicted outer membrane repeat protein